MSQKQTLNEIKWSAPVLLPPLPGQAVQPGLAGSVSGITGHVLLVAGGANFPSGLPWNGAAKQYHNDIYLFEKNNGTLKAPAAPCKEKLPEPVAYGGCVSTPAGIVYAGGENEHGISNKVYRLQYAAGAVSIQPLASLPLPLTNVCAAWYDNKLFIAGGETKDGPSRKCFSLDLGPAPDSKTHWQELPPLPQAVTHAVLVAQSDGHHGCLYLVGGRRKNSNGLCDIYRDVYCYDPLLKHWIKKQSLPYALSAGTGIARGANFILLLGGDKGEVFSAVEKLVLQINAAGSEAERNALIKQKNDLLAAHPGFNKEVLLYNTMTDTWTGIGHFPYAPVATTTAVNWDDDIIIPSGEIRAGVRTPQIIVGSVQKQAFLNNHQH